MRLQGTASLAAGVLRGFGSLRVRFPSPEAEGLSGVFVNTAGGIAGGDRFDIGDHGRRGRAADADNGGGRKGLPRAPDL